MQGMAEIAHEHNIWVGYSSDIDFLYSSQLSWLEL